MLFSWMENFWFEYDLAAQRGDSRCLERGLGWRESIDGSEPSVGVAISSARGVG